MEVTSKKGLAVNRSNELLREDIWGWTKTVGKRREEKGKVKQEPRYVFNFKHNLEWIYFQF